MTVSRGVLLLDALRRVGSYLILGAFVAIPFVPLTGRWFAGLFACVIVGGGLVVVAAATRNETLPRFDLTLWHHKTSCASTATGHGRCTCKDKG